MFANLYPCKRPSAKPSDLGDLLFELYHENGFSEEPEGNTKIGKSHTVIIFQKVLPALHRCDRNKLHNAEPSTRSNRFLKHQLPSVNRKNGKNTEDDTRI